MGEQLEEYDELEATPLEKEIGLLSLDQAFRDFEIANARVIDLTQRLIAANDRRCRTAAGVGPVKTRVDRTPSSS